MWIVPLGLELMGAAGNGVADRVCPAEPKRVMPETVEVIVGVIGRPHGTRGEVAIELRTDEPDRRFAPGQQLRAEGSAWIFTVVSSRAHAGWRLVKFRELPDRTTAETVRGIRLLADVAPNERPVEAGEFYDRQLVGLTVRTADGTEAGRVVSVLHLPQQDLLEVETPQGHRLVPFVEPLVPRVELDQGWLQVADLAGLLDENDE
jgi:16S rRNA processing protein RimM